MMLYFARITRAMDKLSDAQFGQLMKGIIRFAQDGVEPQIDDFAVQIAFEMMRDDIAVDAQKYDAVIDKRRRAGIASGASRRASAQNAEQNEHVLTHARGVQQNEPIPITIPDPIPITNPIPITIPKIDQHEDTRAADIEWGAFVKEYEANIGLFPHTQYESEELVGDFETLGRDVMSEAVRATTLAHAENPHVYFRRVCQKWIQTGIKTAEQARTAIAEFQRKKEAKAKARQENTPATKAEAFLAMMRSEDNDT